MTQPTFVITRYQYDSYDDLYHLIGLSGYPCCFVDEMDVEDASKVYILVTRNGEWGDGWANAKARLIHYVFEWEQYPPIAGVTELWSPDAWHARLIGARYVPLGGHPGLMDHITPSPDEQYDVCFLAYLTGRRQHMRGMLSGAGYRLTPWSARGKARDPLLQTSTLYLHVHQDEARPAVPALRLIVAAAYSLPVICETPADQGAFLGKIITEDYNRIPVALRHWLNEANGAWTYGDALYQYLCIDHNIIRCIEGAV